MIPTLDPFGGCSGDKSVWDKEFEAKSSDDLRHDRPYTVRMVNAGPRANFLL